MSSEREVVTLAFGNYASLVAAQWANGTTAFDVSRRTLYSERRADAVRGGETAQQRTGAVLRVPRVVLLDAPHATQLRCTRRTMDVGDCAGERKKREEERGDLLDVDNRYRAGTDKKAAKWDSFSSSSSGFRGDDLGDDESLKQEDYAGEVCLSHDDEEHADLNDSKRDGVSFDNTLKSMTRIKRELFNEADELVPWWQYIRSGVSNDSVHVLHPLHRLGGTVGDVPLLHSFGFGMSQLHSSHSDDIAGMTESLRRQLEDADLLQGVQCFVDGDSAFAGAACNVMGEFWEDAGHKIPALFFTSFQPLPHEVMMPGSEIDFADRRKDETCLNRLLATSHMTRHDSAVYVPLELAHWPTFFAGDSEDGAHGPAWLQNDTATAQLIATLADTALYGVRDDGSIDGSAGKPAFYMHDWLTAVRPTRGLRVAAAFAAMPLRVYNANLPRNDFWDFLQHHPLLSTTRTGGDGFFAPLTHSMGFDHQTEAGRVLGHALTLRGAGKLLDITYPRQEALLRYGLPLRTANYLPLVTGNSYPISSTFPRDFVVPGEFLASGALKEIDVGSHVVSTYGSAPMLQEIVTSAEKILHRRRALYEETYGVDSDEWKEVMEDVLEIRDDYNHCHSDNEDDDAFDEADGTY